LCSDGVVKYSPSSAAVAFMPERREFALQRQAVIAAGGVAALQPLPAMPTGTR
jgi:hypothetical protein